mgnify:CR=1 FL=1
MFTGTKTGNSNGSYLKTGLSAFTFLGVNPSASQIEEWTGRTDVQEPNYDIQDDYSKEHQVRPVTIYLRNEEGVTVNFRINLSKDDAIAKSGNYKVCTSTGGVVWAKNDGGVKPEFENHKPLRIGEADLINFVAKLINFDTKSGENLYQQMVMQKVDLDSLYQGLYEGMTNLATWAQEKEKQISMVLVVREKDVVGQDGSIVTKQYQGVSGASETWFSGKVTDWAEKKLLERYEKSLEVGRGQTQAYPLIKDLFTIKYQDFNKEDCFNNVPENPQPSGTWN